MPNYLELVLAKRPDGEIHIVDVFSLRAGALQTEALRSSLLPSRVVLEEVNRRLAPTVFDLYTEGNSAFDDFIDHLLRNRQREADEIFAKNLTPLRRNRRAHVLRLGVAAQLGTDAYAQAIRDMEAGFPNDPSLLLPKLEVAAAKLDLKGLLEAVDAIERRVGVDPYLDVVRASAHFSADDLSRARSFAERATAAEPDLAPALWRIVAVALRQKDFKAVAQWLSTIEERLGVEIGDLSAVPLYEQFVKSPEYTRWLEWREK